MAAKTIIEINGKKYDARTGEIISSSEKSHSVKPANSVPQKVVFPQHGVIDSMQRPKRNTAERTKLKPKAQKSKTLVRSVVKKPILEVQNIEAQPKELIEPHLFNRTPSSRANRANSVQQSKKVSRFASSTPANAIVTEHMKVKKAPLETKAAPEAAPPVHGEKTTHPTKKQVFTHPLAKANAHLALPPKKRKVHQKLADKLKVSGKAMSLAAGCMAVIILAGFFAYQRVPNISMRVAAARAGFSGTIPSNTPTGYAFKGPIEYAKNTIGITYKSNSDERLFKIVQRPTTWSNEALVANYVRNNNMKYQTYEDKGLKVYVMEGSNASWVDSGIWYTLSSSGTLSTEQILAIAGSM